MSGHISDNLWHQFEPDISDREGGDFYMLIPI